VHKFVIGSACVPEAFVGCGKGAGVRFQQTVSVCFSGRISKVRADTNRDTVVVTVSSFL